VVRRASTERGQEVAGPLDADEIGRNEASRPVQEVDVLEADAQLAKTPQRHAKIDAAPGRREPVAGERQQVRRLVEDQVVDRDVLVLLLEIGVWGDVETDVAGQRLSKLAAHAREVAAEYEIIAPFEPRIIDPRQPVKLAYTPPTTAPMLVPAMQSIGMRLRSNTLSTPRCA
jgi:hypothetical protein